ncbi:MAG: ribonuclease Y [Planctomycetota bacterium]|nr:ribonuclease Y [Planctomycetota bacterium]
MAIDPLSIGIGIAGGAVVGGLIASTLMKGNRDKLEAQAREEGERLKQRMQDEARAEVAKLRAEESESALKRRKEFEKEIKAQQDEVREAEKRLEKREDMLDRKLSTIERKEQDIARLEQKRQEQVASIEARKKELDLMYEDEKRKLQTISQLTPDQAKAMLLERVKSDIEVEVVEMTNRALNRAKENADADARKIILNTIQRLASDYVAENTVSTIDLPNDDMKGRIIGREGRNIRAFEKATGVDVIVDDTPGVVVLSCFEPVRREVARLTMEKLIADGRIHPTRIEDAKTKSEQEVTTAIEKSGKEAAIEFGCHDIHPRLKNMLGRLRYRTSYGQNVLNHSKEVAHICGLLAAELKLDVQLAKRCGLLHDCGKALDQEMEGTHPQIGMDVAKQVDERVEVWESIGGHHGDIEVHSLYPILVTVADAISAARPGARRESLEKYVQRMKKLEEIATTKKGIEKAYAIQAGREVRVLAKAEELSDNECQIVARDIAKQIEDELSYPGEVRVTLIREARFIEYAR